LYTNEDVCYSWTGVVEKLEEDCEVTPIKQISRDAALTIFPNPAQNLLYLNAQSSMNNIEIYSGMGALLSHIRINDKNKIIDVSNFQPGMYFIRVTLLDGKITTSKFIKN